MKELTYTTEDLCISIAYKQTDSEDVAYDYICSYIMPLLYAIGFSEKAVNEAFIDLT